MSIEALRGKTLTHIRQIADDALHFCTTEGELYRMYHRQDCCECVTIEDICGDINDLIGTPILVAEERTSFYREIHEHVAAVLTGEHTYDKNESQTWTFYELATIKGSVTIRWYGTSNGYYSETVDFELVEGLNEQKIV